MDILTKLRIRRRCCARMLMTDVNHTDDYLKYPHFPDRIRLVGSRFTGDDILDGEDDGEESPEEGDGEEEEVVKPKKAKVKAKGKAKKKKDEDE